MAAATRKILVSLYDAEQEYQRLQVSDAGAAAARAGLEVEVVFCNGSTTLQRKQIEAAVQRPEGARPVAVVVQPYASAGLDSAARAALTARIGWVVLGPDSSIDNLRREFPGVLAAQVTTDHRQIGALQSEIVRTLLPGGGRVLAVEGPSLSPAVLQRRQGLLEGLRGSKVELFKTLTGDWSEHSGEKVATFWVKLGTDSARPDLVVAQNDSMALGARKAIQALRPAWGDLPFVGCDGLPGGGQKAVREKVLTATVVNPTTTGPAIELVAAALRGQPAPATRSLAPSTFPGLSELSRGRR